MNPWWLLVAFWAGGAVAVLAMVLGRGKRPRRFVSFVTLWPWSIVWFSLRGKF